MSNSTATSEYARATSATTSDQHRSSTDDNPASPAERLLSRQNGEDIGYRVRTAVLESGSTRGIPSDDSSSREGTFKDAHEPFRPPNKSQTLSKWRFEILALFVSMSAFAAIIATLEKHDGKPPPESAYLNVSTLVAIFSTTLRATVAYVVAEGKRSMVKTFIGDLLTKSSHWATEMAVDGNCSSPTTSREVP